jgi:hypothetical protein
MRTLVATLPHESLFFDNSESFRAQNERYFAAGRRTRSRSPRASALAVCADESPASPKKWGVRTLLLAAKPEPGGKMNPHFAAVTFNPRLQITPTSQSPCCKTLPFRLTFSQSTVPHPDCGKSRARLRNLESTSARVPQSAVNNRLAQRRKGAKNAKPVFLASLPLCVLAR